MKILKKLLAWIDAQAALHGQYEAHLAAGGPR